jgi:hypothetical protein
VALQGGQLRKRVIGAAVVHGEDLIRAAVRRKHSGKLPIELRHVGRFVPHRDDDRDIRIHAIAINA